MGDEHGDSRGASETTEEHPTSGWSVRFTRGGPRAGEPERSPEEVRIEQWPYLIIKVACCRS